MNESRVSKLAAGGSGESERVERREGERERCVETHSKRVAGVAILSNGNYAARYGTQLTVIACVYHAPAASHFTFVSSHCELLFGHTPFDTLRITDARAWQRTARSRTSSLRRRDSEMRRVTDMVTSPRVSRALIALQSGSTMKVCHREHHVRASHVARVATRYQRSASAFACAADSTLLALLTLLTLDAVVVLDVHVYPLQPARRSQQKQRQTRTQASCMRLLTDLHKCLLFRVATRATTK